MEPRVMCSCRVRVAGERAEDGIEDDDASLALADGELLLSYWDERGVVVFAGSERQPGCFELAARSRPRRATLRRQGAGRFVGEWVEGERRGSLDVELADAPAADPPA